MRVTSRRLLRLLFSPPRLSRETALQTAERLGALTHMVASLELLSSDKDHRPGGVNNWQLTRPLTRFKSPLALRLLDLVAQHGVTRGLHVARVTSAAAVLLPTPWRLRLVADAVLAGSQILLYQRHRFSTDGSDQAAFLVSAMSTVARASQGRPRLADAALWYIAVQAGLSYGASGWAKVLGPVWRSGAALPAIMRTITYGDRRTWTLIKRYPRSAKAIGAGVLAMEALFPIVFVGPGRRLAPMFVASAAAFHVANARLMGLNRFLPAFLAMHAPVLYAVAPREGGSTLSTTDRRDDLLPKVIVTVGGTLAALGAVAARHNRTVVRSGRAGEMTMHMSSHNTLRYHCSGADEGTQPLVVCVGGLMSTAETWEWIARELRPTHPVLTYQRAGYGGSVHAAGDDHRLDVAVSDLVELAVAEAGERPIVLIGHSLGGYLAWRAAARLHDRIRAVVLLDPLHLEAGKLIENQPSVVEWMDQSLRLLPVWLRAGWGPLLKESTWVRDLPDDIKPLVRRQSIDAASWVAARREWTALRREFTIADPMGRLDVPALVITAGDTATAHPQQAALHVELAESAAQSERHVLDGVDHDGLVMRREPARRVAELVGGFLEGVDRQAAHDRFGREPEAVAS